MNLLIKLAVNGIIGIPGLWWSGTSLTFAVLTSVVVSLIAYALGDALILPKTNNTFATTADFIMVFALFWFGSFAFAQPYRLPGILLTALAITVAEYFYHGYLQHRGVHHSKHPG